MQSHDPVEYNVCADSQVLSRCEMSYLRCDRHSCVTQSEERVQAEL